MWVDEVEALPHQRLFVVENHAMEVDKRLGVDEDANVFKVVNTIPFAMLRIEPYVVGETRTSAALDAQTEPPRSGEDPSLAMASRIRFQVCPRPSLPFFFLPAFSPLTPPPPPLPTPSPHT